MKTHELPKSILKVQAYDTELATSYGEFALHESFCTILTLNINPEFSPDSEEVYIILHCSVQFAKNLIFKGNDCTDSCFPDASLFCFKPFKFKFLFTYSHCFFTKLELLKV